MAHLKQLLVAVSITIVFNAYTQTPTFNPFFFGQSSLETKVTPINLTSIGQHYVDQKWNAGNIYLKNGDSLIAYYMRYDLIRNHLEIILDTKIIALNGSFISRFEWFSVDRLKPEYFINKERYDFGDDPISTFIEVLEDGRLKLIKNKIVFAPQQATSPTLVNDTDEQIQILEKYYLVKNDVVHELSRNKKKNIEFIAKAGLSEYIKKANLRFNSENDLKEIIRFANQNE